jgi:RHS repeat-associated protein
MRWFPRRALTIVTTISLVSLALTNVQVASPSPASATPVSLDAEDSVVEIARDAVAPNSMPDGSERDPQGKPLPMAKRFQPSWPRAGSATVAVPERGQPAVRVGSTALSVTAPGGDRRATAADQVAVRVMDDEGARRAGGHGVAFQLSNAGEHREIGIRIDVSGFARAFGGDFRSRLRLVEKPACVLRSPASAKCATGTPVPSHVDLTNDTLVAQAVPANDASVFVVVAAVNGETGTPAATDLSSSSKWSVGEQSGAFSWTIPVPAVPAVAEDTPELSLSYSSQAVDGMVASENNQPSWVGQGWELGLPFIERSYNSCGDDGQTTGDLCWAGEHLSISLNEVSSPLVRDRGAQGDVWRARDDPGWRIQRLTGAANGDDNGEHWVVTTPNGVRYVFGQGRQPTTNRVTNSAFTVPVFGDDAGEPCHAGTFADAWCVQAWRWNLDRIEDPRGNVSTYLWSQETNRYARNGDPAKSTDYVRAGHATSVEYSQRSGSEGVQAPARLRFTLQPRCVEAAGGTGTCPEFNQANASSYPDAPLSSLCTGICTGDDQRGPTFFTGQLLRSVSAERSGGDGSWVEADRLTFTYSYPQPSDGTDPALWLDKVAQTGFGGDGETTLPAVEFTGTELVNRADADPANGVPEQRKLRITRVIDELSRAVSVRYGQPDPCEPLPTGSFDTNTKNCFPAWRTNGEDSGFGVWHKYLATAVTVSDTTGGGPDQTVEYRYHGDSAWHYDDNPVVPSERKSWSDWRGYDTVDVAKLTSPAYQGEETARTLTLRRTLYFRGMDGDRIAGGGTKSVSVTDSTDATRVDHAWLRGQKREERHFQVTPAGEESFELKGSLHDFSSAHTTQAGDSPDAGTDAHLVVEHQQLRRETTIADSGERGSRSVRIERSYDDFGQLTQELDVAGEDVRCTKHSYARDAATVSRWMVAFPFRQRTYTGTCAAPAKLVSGTDTHFDGATSPGAPLVRADATSSVTAVSASAPDTVDRTVTTQATYDVYGRVTSITDGERHTTRNTYEPATGHPRSIMAVNPLGHRTVTTMDPDRQQPAVVLDANGNRTFSAFDPLGRLASVRLPDQAAGDPAAYVFDYVVRRGEVSRVTTSRLQSGSTYLRSWTFLDALGRSRQTQTVSPASTGAAPRTILVDTGYDDAGNVATESLPAVAPGTPGSALLAVPAGEVDQTRHRYDSLDRVVSSTQFGQGRELWSSTMDQFGDHVRITPPRGAAVETVWTDARGREVRKQQGTGDSLVTTSRTYTPADLVETVTDPAGHMSRYTYDLMNRRTAAQDVDAGKSRMEYDANDNQVRVWDAKALAAGRPTPTVSTDYDGLGRPTARWAGASGSGTRLSTWEYDSTRIANGIGVLAAQTTHQGDRKYTQAVTGYDTRGRATGSAWTFPVGVAGLTVPKTFSVGYEYDSADHLATVEYKDSMPGAGAERVTTGYDDLGLPVTLRGDQDYVTGTEYAADGKLAARDYANRTHPLRRAYAYEQDTQRLARVRTSSGDQTLQDDTFAWDPAGNLEKVVDNALSDPVATCHRYDALARLGRAWTTERTDCSDGDDPTVDDGPAGFNKSWTYSKDGNITAIRSLRSTRTFSYEDREHPHAVTKSGDTKFEYDANGSMVERAEGLLGELLPTTMEWDTQQQLRQVSQLSVPVLNTDFVYLPDGTRVARIDPVGLAATFYIDGQEIEVVAGLVKFGTRFYAQGDTTVALRTTTGLVWQLNDRQSSAQLAVPNGTRSARRTYYDPYGAVRPSSASPPSDRGWLGKTRDPSTGLNHLDARYYDADLGRFLSPDPLIGDATAQTANPYAYAANNPVSYSDPSGLLPIMCMDCLHLNAQVLANQLKAEEEAIDRLNEPALGRDLTPQERRWLRPYGYPMDGDGTFTVLDAIMMAGQSQQAWMKVCELMGGDRGYCYSGTKHPTWKEAAPFAKLLYELSPIADVAGCVGGSSDSCAWLGAALLGAAAFKMATKSGEKIEDTLQQAANDARNTIGAGSGSVYGTKVHAQFKDILDALGRGDLHTEVSYLGGREVAYGTKGSVRLDVVVGSKDKPLAIYDLKTGSAKLTASRIAQIRQHLPPNYRNIPILEVRPQ